MEQFIHILHLEDDPADAELIQAKIESAGLCCQITRAQTRDEFAEALRQGGYDVILADFHLPMYDGLSALRLAQERCPDVPFVFVSGVMGEDAAIEGLTKGATDYVLKQKLSRLAPAIIRALHEAENRCERRRAEGALRASEEKYRMLFEEAFDCLFITSPAGKILDINKKGILMFGYDTEDEILSLDLERDVYAYPSARKQVLATANTQGTAECEIVFKKKSGEQIVAHCAITAVKDEQGVITTYRGIIRDITQRKRLEEQLRVSHKFLILINRHRKISPLLEELVAELKHLTGCAAVGIRLLDEAGNIPYKAYDGFSQEFYQLESPLSIHSDRCMCINVITGQVDPQLPFYTASGSFYINGTTRFLSTVTEEEKGATRNVCHQFGYETVVLVPIRVKEQVLGLIHLADTRENAIAPEMIPTLEDIALQLGANLLRLQAEEALQHYTSRLQALSRRLVEVQETERRHIARELHDEVGQTLTGLKLLLAVIPRLPAETVPTRLAEALRLVDELMNLVHDLSLDLRPGMLDDLGLLPALLWLVERYTTRTGVRVFFEQQRLKQRFPPEVETTAYRIVQEALTNIARHAGVDEAAVRLRADQSTLYLLVQDAGPGFDLPAVLARGQTIGLVNMQERAALLGGWLKIDSESGRGTQVSAALPLKFNKETR